MAVKGYHWPRRVGSVLVEEVHPGLLQWVLGGVVWRWHFWGGAVSRGGRFVMNAKGSPNRVIAFSQGFEEGIRDESERIQVRQETGDTSPAD